MKTKKEIFELEKEVAKLFLKAGMEPPRRLLPNIIFDWMTPEHCFKTRMRTIISKMRLKSNFIINEDGTVIVKQANDKPALIKNDKNFNKADELISLINKRLGININKI